MGENDQPFAEVYLYFLHFYYYVFAFIPDLLPQCSIVTFFVYYAIRYENIYTCTFKYTVQCMYLNLTHDNLSVVIRIVGRSTVTMYDIIFLS